MIRTFVLTHAEAPKSLNAGGAGSRRHWAVAYREKQRWTGIYVMLLLAGKVPQHMTFCRAEAIIRWKHRARRDSTNYIASIVKPLADTLAPPAGSPAPRWLPDDTDEYFKFEGVSFEYPDEWDYKDPRVKAELVVRLDATYLEDPPSAPGVRDAC